MTVNIQTQPQNSKKQQIVCGYCKKPGHVLEECCKRNRKQQERQLEKQTTKRPNAKTYPPCPYCQIANHTTDLCWNGPNAANRPKRYKTGNLKYSTDDSHEPGTSTQNVPTSILRNPSN